jgi:hypothetical protein
MSYWQARRTMRYYTRVLDLARHFAPAGGGVIDVGGRDCEYIAWFDWFERKVVLDLKPPPERPGVEVVAGDFLTYSPPQPFDLVLCLQVLEHLAEPAQFCRKLLSTGPVVIVSVPYLWPRGMCSFHLQDPVDEARLADWAGVPPVEQSIVRDGARERLVAVFVV